MISELDEILNDLLSRWHWWATHFLYGQGFYNAQPYAHMAPPLHGDTWDAPEVRDQHAENAELAEVDAAINELPQPHRTAVWINARNLCTGAAVWSSARLPADPIERAQLVVDARALLVVQLQRREVISEDQARGELTVEGFEA